MKEITGFNRLCLVYFDISLLTTHAMRVAQEGDNRVVPQTSVDAKKTNRSTNRPLSVRVEPVFIAEPAGAWRLQPAA
ncbi:MAG TPA: hypothetical protein VKZ94_17345 [Advenella sp.]|nr:hypothetical protein [Advenella sp.]